ncbi:MAG: diaminopimelate decarboxylase [Bdellovibrionales bacterium]
MAYEYANGVLGIRRNERFLPLSDVVKGHGEAVYVYSSDDVLNRIDWYKKAFARPVKIHFAMKANPFLPLLQIMARQKIGADVVSGGELERALEAGIAAEAIVFSGVGKSAAELKRALDCGIGQINIESLPELERLAELSRGQKARVRVGLRLNPDVRPDTHHHITTGHRENKFGLNLEHLREAVAILRTNEEHLKFYGLAMHVGSQILNTTTVIEAVRLIRRVFEDLRKEGWPLQSLDIGGGLGIDYTRTDAQGDLNRLQSYAANVEVALKGLDCDLLVEPGRFLVARSGVLLTQIEYVKQTPHRNFVILNSGMNHLMRPALYQAEHRIVPLFESKGRTLICDIVGPICESTDVLGRQRSLPAPRSGDWLAVLDTGAYGYSMANQYNLRSLPVQILL